MLVVVAVGTVVVILVTVGALKLTMREEPSGCLLAFGSLLMLVVLAVTIILWS